MFPGIIGIRVLVNWTNEQHGLKKIPRQSANNKIRIS